MNNIWAPWRIKYIEDEPANDECFLCRACAAPKRDEKNYVVYRGAKTFAILNRFPYNNGHMLIAPNSHIAELSDLDDLTLLEISKTAIKIKDRLDRTLRPDGFNMGYNFGRVAGAGLPGHLHFHIVPRWNGDTNFMPVLGDVKVIPQSLEELCRTLRSNIE